MFRVHCNTFMSFTAHNEAAVRARIQDRAPQVCVRMVENVVNQATEVFMWSDDREALVAAINEWTSGDEATRLIGQIDERPGRAADASLIDVTEGIVQH